MILIDCQPRSSHADAAVVTANQHHVEDVHHPVAIGVTRTPRLNELAVVARYCGHVEDIDDVIAVGIAGANRRECGQQESKHVSLQERSAPAEVQLSGAWHFGTAQGVEAFDGTGPPTVVYGYYIVQIAVAGSVLASAGGANLDPLAATGSVLWPALPGAGEPIVSMEGSYGY